MGETPSRALLPPGFSDTLPPHAGREAAAVSSILGHFAAHGFLQVKPPLVEFEETLFGGIGAAKRDQSFRVMDPVSHRMLAIRPDMTVQIARMAASRLASTPRPLRLSYAGQVLRVTAGQVRPERQFTQLGAEIIGAEGRQADTHIIALAVQALERAGIEGVSVDLTLPGLVGVVLPDLADPENRTGPLANAIEGKDVGAVAELAGPAADLMIALIDSGGPAAEALDAVRKLDLPEQGRALLDRLSETVEGLVTHLRDIVLTVDFVERRGFEYQTGVGFTLFARDLREELGRGGSYLAGLEFGNSEPATGVSLFMDSILRGLPETASDKKLLVPGDLSASDADHLQAQGWTTVHLLDGSKPGPEAARQQLCSYYLVDGEFHQVEG
ncbi:MAG: ATP phosphoribosyltransferase regulatory subunit [Pseudomonadota bacterium]